MSDDKALETLGKLLKSWNEFVENCEDPSILKDGEKFVEPLKEISEGENVR